MHDQYCLVSQSKYQAGFGVVFPTCMIHIYSTTALYDTLISVTLNTIHDACMCACC